MRTILGVLALAVLGGCEKQPHLCYVDCPSGARCHDGKVIEGGYIANTGYPPNQAPCMSMEELDKACSSGATVLLECPKGCPKENTYDVDSRYSACAKHVPSLNVLHCAEGTPKVPGAACAQDADCRPAHSSVARLTCVSGKCVEAARLPAPASYGQTCALTDVSYVPSGLVLVEAPSCPLCLISKQEGSCFAQVCSMACELDEDCPEGSVCSCHTFESTVDNDGQRLFCAPGPRSYGHVDVSDWPKCW